VVETKPVETTRRGEAKLTVDEAGVKLAEKGAKGYGEPIRKENNKWCGIGARVIADHQGLSFTFLDRKVEQSAVELIRRAKDRESEGRGRRRRDPRYLSSLAWAAEADKESGSPGGIKMALQRWPQQSERGESGRKMRSSKKLG
jgi:hypothetical protein